MPNEAVHNRGSSLNRRQFLAVGAGSVAAAAGAGHAAEAGASRVVRPPEGKRILLARELG